MKLGLENKVALVTGGNSGIGRAIAMAFAEEGAKVIIAARNVALCEETVNTIRQSGGDCIYVKTDVSKPEEVKAMVQKAIDTYGRLDCAVNNAAAQTVKPYLEHTEEDWDLMLNLNLKGVWTCMMNEIPHMLKQGGGSIVNISSASGLLGMAKVPLYTASKHGVLGLTKSAAIEFAQQGLRINAICPGPFITPMMMKCIETPEMLEASKTVVPMGRIGDPKELAAPAVFLCSDKASFITGITLSVDGGWTQH